MFPFAVGDEQGKSAWLVTWRGCPSVMSVGDFLSSWCDVSAQQTVLHQFKMILFMNFIHRTNSVPVW